MFVKVSIKLFSLLLRCVSIDKIHIDSYTEPKPKTRLGCYINQKRKVTKITKYNGCKRDLLKSFVEWTLNIERNNFKQNHYSDRLSTIEKTDTVSPKESRMSVNLKSDVK